MHKLVGSNLYKMYKPNQFSSSIYIIRHPDFSDVISSSICTTTRVSNNWILENMRTRICFYYIYWTEINNHIGQKINLHEFLRFNFNVPYYCVCHWTLSLLQLMDIQTEYVTNIYVNCKNHSSEQQNVVSGHSFRKCFKMFTKLNCIHRTVLSHWMTCFQFYRRCSLRLGLFVDCAQNYLELVNNLIKSILFPGGIVVLQE